ncbi:MAG TPA: 3-carboxy-cis,cis-muconate cycloisomerase [Candidatus Saccharimonadales bacterium]|jgi:3-carboxy-cis,cis-muconate cycloisomerase|nr:3-carboxy-cis,cis-muconate cycloisomerase [Candidatus Saccharimonadales bacterium]
MPVRLIDSLATTGPLAELFSDRSIVQAMVEFEIALARAQAALGIIPVEAPNAIVAATRNGSFDAADHMSSWANDTLHAGTPAIPFVAALTARVRSQHPAAAGFLHWGATSQDVCDTAMVLLLKQAQSILEPDLQKLEQALRQLAERHAQTVMLGRTLLQPAPPITFGLKAAGWLAALQRSRRRLDAAFRESLVLQFGGASGTLAALGSDGLAVGQAMAKELGLSYPDAPWHTQRDRLAALLCCCGVLTGVLGKMARDILLLTQAETGEAAEASAPGAGGSSTMPHKHNPVGCTAALASAGRVPALVSSYLTGMMQEHERAAGGWQAEWPTVAGIVQGTGVAAASMAEVMTGLTVDEARMTSNIEATQGTIFAEKAMMLLAKKLGRDTAHKLMEEAVRQCRQQGRRLGEVLAEMPEVKDQLLPSDLRDLEKPEQYLGMSDEFRKRQLAAPGGKKTKT